MLEEACRHRAIYGARSRSDQISDRINFYDSNGIRLVAPMRNPSYPRLPQCDRSLSVMSTILSSESSAHHGNALAAVRRRSLGDRDVAWPREHRDHHQHPDADLETKRRALDRLRSPRVPSADAAGRVSSTSLIVRSARITVDIVRLAGRAPQLARARSRYLCRLSAAMDPAFSKPFPPGFLPSHDSRLVADPSRVCPVVLIRDRLTRAKPLFVRAAKKSARACGAVPWMREG